jgi:hypothetical protein
VTERSQGRRGRERGGESVCEREELGQEAEDASSKWSPSIVLLYWHKSTSTDAEGAACVCVCVCIICINIMYYFIIYIRTHLSAYI